MRDLSQNHRVFDARFSLLVMAILLFTGTSGCHHPQRSPLEPGLTPIPQRASPPPTAPRPSEPPVADGEPLQPLPDSTWISLDQWCREHALPPPHPLATVEDGFEIVTPKGVLAVRLHTREAYWNDLVCWLGFAPRHQNDQLWLHRLDMEKLFFPLLRLNPATFEEAKTIVIDPGHGGTNRGAKSIVTERYEKEYTLDWALRLRPLLEARGWRVILTREDDSKLSLAERNHIAETHQADLFISLHFNSVPYEHPTGGMETFCITPVGMPSHLISPQGEETDIALPNNRYDEQNIQLAALVHGSLLRRTGRLDRGIRRARFMGVLWRQKRPAILLEAGFLANPEEAALIATPEYRQELAEAVADALSIDDGR